MAKFYSYLYYKTYKNYLHELPSSHDSVVFPGITELSTYSPFFIECSGGIK